jgi:peptide-methionine (S)-S-oxide reductase
MSRENIQTSGLWPNPIVTEITKFINFYPAEREHQSYYNLNPQQPYCRAIIDPKMKKFKEDFQDRLH